MPSVEERAWLFDGEAEATGVRHIDARSWHQMTPARLAAFRAEYAQTLAAYDGFVVTHALSLALLYEPLGKPIVAVNTCRCARAPVAARPWRRRARGGGAPVAAARP